MWREARERIFDDRFEGPRSSDRAVICCTRAKNLSEPGVFSRAVATEMTGIEAWRSDGRHHEVSILITVVGALG